MDINLALALVLVLSLGIIAFIVPIITLKVTRKMRRVLLWYKEKNELTDPELAELVINFVQNIPCEESSSEEPYPPSPLPGSISSGLSRYGCRGALTGPQKNQKLENGQGV